MVTSAWVVDRLTIVGKLFHHCSCVVVLCWPLLIIWVLKNFPIFSHYYTNDNSYYCMWFYFIHLYDCMLLLLSRFSRV